MQVVSGILLAIVAMGSAIWSSAPQAGPSSKSQCIHTFHDAPLDGEQEIESVLAPVGEVCCLPHEERAIGCHSSLREVLHFPKLFVKEMDT